ncbi:MAG: hypothetical protein HY520_03880, partial [Candidatus Aenigmarchaeota archaeon]|nr:hypothetical protein [Candidatus Aenigmarchaeota archaeon]
MNAKENALEKAVQLAEPPPERKALSGHIAAIGREIDALERKRIGLLPIEADARKAVSRRITVLGKEREGLQQEIKKLRESPPCKRLSLEPLGWRDEQGRPRLVLFRPDRPTFTLGGGKWFLRMGLAWGMFMCCFTWGLFTMLQLAAIIWAMVIGVLVPMLGMVAIDAVPIFRSLRALPKRLRACYADVIPHLRQFDLSVERITTRFTGVIPPATRERIG